MKRFKLFFVLFSLLHLINIKCAEKSFIENFLEKKTQLLKVVNNFIILNQRYNMEKKYLEEIDLYKCNESYKSQEEFEEIKKAAKEEHRLQIQQLSNELEQLKKQYPQLESIYY